ncbi:glycosyltransferase family 2 protein [Mongoliitalea daihaiensis]|uniref:glycosyltransferase family 2 protein n=1 Tax=Mongoliitalea daihaiensis TaxID=2782006 RepID=UPI001F43DA80|nr:glycosyltransferase family 2 protein [Mongoliitalea daihaiensis]UJP64845.1 glycosyltransferase family 2 protein [Mongoliitalea daihaiensis]
MQKAAIVILNYNGRQVLETFLPSVVKYSTFPIIIADNCSQDDSVDFLQKHFSKLQVIQLSKNYGFAQGYNLTLEQLKGSFEFFILLNSDVEVTHRWDIDLIEWLDASPDAVSVQPKILSAQNHTVFDYAGAGGGYLDQLGYPFCRGRILESVEEDHGQYNDIVPVDWSSGACMAVRANDFFDFGGFDRQFFAHMEEIDLCWRWRNAGLQPYYNGHIQVYHFGGGTLSRSNSTKVYLNFRNSLLMNRKNLHGFGFAWVYAHRLVLDVVAMLFFLVKGQLGFVKAVLKAHLDYGKMSKNIITSSHSHGHAKKKRPYAILWHYYGLGYRMFSPSLIE